ncbi:MAG TPA: hypothetical protein VIH71_06495 [Solirubrobacteraceae bacterium]
MRYLSDANRFRRITAGICLIAAPLALLVGTVIHPGLRLSERAQLALINQHPDRWYANHILGFISMILFVPAVFGVVHILRERAAVLAHLGGTLAFLGLFAFEGVVVAYGFVAWQMATSDSSVIEMVALAHRLRHTAGVIIPLGLMSTMLVPGLGLLAIGLIRAHVPHRWAGPLAPLGVVLFLIGGQTAHMTLMIAGTTCMLVGLGTIGLCVLRTSDAEWALPTSTPPEPKIGSVSVAATTIVGG